MENESGISRREVLRRGGLGSLAVLAILAELYGASEISESSLSSEDREALRTHNVADIPSLSPEQVEAKRNRGTTIMLGSLVALGAVLLASLRYEDPQQY